MESVNIKQNLRNRSEDRLRSHLTQRPRFTGEGTTSQNDELTKLLPCVCPKDTPRCAAVLALLVMWFLPMSACGSHLSRALAQPFARRRWLVVAGDNVLPGLLVGRGGDFLSASLSSHSCSTSTVSGPE